MPHRSAAKLARRTWHVLLWLVAMLWSAALHAHPQDSAPPVSVLTLTASPGQHDGWAVARVLPDPEAALSVLQVLRSATSFGPATMPANLG